MHYRKDTRCFSASLQFTLADSEALRHQPCSHCHNIHSDAWQHIHYYSKTLMFRCAGGSSGALATWFGASLCHLDMVPCAPTVWAPCPATAVASGTLESFRTFVCMQRHTRDPGLFDEASCELASIIPPQKKTLCLCLHMLLHGWPSLSPSSTMLLAASQETGEASSGAGRT